MRKSLLRSLFFQVVLAACLLGSPAVAQEAFTAMPVAPFSEQLRTEAPVSGRALLGAIVLAPATPGNADVFIRAPQRLAGQALCLTIVSRDGRYYARNGFVVPEITSVSTVRLPVQTAHPKVFSGALGSEVTSLIEEGACGANSRNILPVSARAIAPEAPVVLSINSGRATARILAGTAGNERSFPCLPIETGRRTTYDAICTLDASVSRTSGAVPLQIELCSFGECRRSRVGELNFQ
jgi:hypothetical protein